MNENQGRELTPGQARTLQELMQAGYQFASLEHVARHIVLDKVGFVALLDPVGGELKLFGQIGYRVGDGIGMLVERGGKSFFVWKKQEVEATPDLLAVYQRVKAELKEILEAKGEA